MSPALGRSLSGISDATTIPATQEELEKLRANLPAKQNQQARYIKPSAKSQFSKVSSSITQQFSRVILLLIPIEGCVQIETAISKTFFLFISFQESPSTPYFDQSGGGVAKMLPVPPKPTAVKSPPPPLRLESVAKPLCRDRSPPMPGSQPLLNAPIQPPAKKIRVDTGERVNRLIAPTPTKAPSVVSRSLSRELDAVSESMEPLNPNSSLVFPHGAPECGGGSLFAPTPVSAPSTPHPTPERDTRIWTLLQYVHNVLSSKNKRNFWFHARTIMWIFFRS